MRLPFYFTRGDVLEAWAAADAHGDGAPPLIVFSRTEAMRAAIAEVEERLRRQDGVDIWSPDVKATDEVLDRIFRVYFSTIDQGMRFRKADYHALVDFMPRDAIDPEVIEKLDRIAAVATAAEAERAVTSG